MIELLARALHEKNMQIEALEHERETPAFNWLSIKRLLSSGAGKWFKV